MRSIRAFGRTWDLVVERQGTQVRVIVEQAGKRVYDRTLASGATVEIVLPQAPDRPILRGTPMVLGKALEASVAFAMDVKNWQQIKDLGLNSVRVCCVDPWYADRNKAHWTAEEVLPNLDKCVKNAEATGLNVIINYHNVGEQQEQRKSGKPLDFSRLARFWRLVAPRYKDRAHVFYELSNEPTFDGSTFLKPDFHKGLMGVYREVRQDAPQRTVLLFSFNSTESDLKAIVDTYASEIDWDHAMVAFHFYGGDGTSRAA